MFSLLKKWISFYQEIDFFFFFWIDESVFLIDILYEWFYILISLLQMRFILAIIHWERWSAWPYIFHWTFKTIWKTIAVLAMYFHWVTTTKYLFVWYNKYFVPHSNKLPTTNSFYIYLKFFKIKSVISIFLKYNFSFLISFNGALDQRDVGCNNIHI